jgi:hypothetical protein
MDEQTMKTVARSCDHLSNAAFASPSDFRRTMSARGNKVTTRLLIK